MHYIIFTHGLVEPVMGFGLHLLLGQPLDTAGRVHSERETAKSHQAAGLQTLWLGSGMISGCFAWQDWELEYVPKGMAF